MPLHDDASPSKFQAFVSTYLMESLSYTFLETNEIHIWTPSTIIPKDFPIQLNTSSIGIFMPSLLQKYGADKLIDVEYQLDKVGNFSVFQDNDTFAFDGSITIKLWVNTEPGQKEKAMDLKLISNHFKVTVEIPTDSLNVTIKVEEIFIGELQLNYTTVEDIDMKVLAELLNECLEIGLPHLNTYLQTLKIIIPENLFGLFELSNLTLKYHDNFIEAGLTPTFLPPRFDIPGIYEKFIPLEPFDMTASSEDFKTFMIIRIDENDNVTYTYADDFNYYSYGKSMISSLWQDDTKFDLFLI